MAGCLRFGPVIDGVQNVIGIKRVRLCRNACTGVDVLFAHGKRSFVTPGYAPGKAVHVFIELGVRRRPIYKTGQLAAVCIKAVS